MKSKLIERFGEEKRWTNWRLETVNEKQTKVPYFSKTKKSESNNPSTWRTYEEVFDASNNGGNNFSGVGIFFKEDKLLLGVDIDHCVNDGKIEHEKKDIIEKFIKESNTFIEISPSNTGLHLFFEMKTPLDLVAHKKAPFEVYNNLRYLTVTNNIYSNKTIRVVTPEEVTTLLSIIGYPWGRETSSTVSIGLSPISTTENLTDDQILKKMFRAKNGKKFEKIYSGDTSDYKSASEAEYALVGSLAFWTARNPVQMERIWLGSTIGMRDKTQTRKKYRKDAIDSILSKPGEIYEPLEVKIKKANHNLDFDFLFKIDNKGDKVFIQNTENICRVLRVHPNFKDRFRYDCFKGIYEINSKVGKSDKRRWRIIEDNDAVNIQTAISILFPCFTLVGKTMVYEAMIKVAKENTIDSAADFITSLVWDKTYRLDNWLKETFGCPLDAVHKAIASNWLKGLVKRIIEPGCKFDYVLVLEGEQGVGKSTSLSVLGGDWHVETTMSTDSKDFFMQFQGKAIIELSEGETLSRTEVKRMKAIITMQNDKYRPPYERSSQDFPRRCVFAMTTNQGEYLKDDTGNRRWLPVRVMLAESNVKWLKENREQLFAEAYHRVFNKGETIYEFPKEIFDMQKERMISDPNEDLIIDWYFEKLMESSRKEGITTFQAYRDALNGGYPSRPMNKFEEMSIARVLKDTLSLTKKRVMSEGMRAMRWYREEDKEEKLSEDQIKEDAVYKF